MLTPKEIWKKAHLNIINKYNMSSINIVTMFRDSVYWHGRYINHVKKFFDNIDKQKQDNLNINKIICIVSPSHDNTYGELIEQQKERKNYYNIDIIEYLSTSPAVRSIADHNRMVDLSNCGDCGLNKVSNCEGNFTLWVESDLIFSEDKQLFIKLIDAFNKINNLGCVAPLIFLNTRRHIFYDTFVFKDEFGINWTNKKPWCKQFNRYDRYINMQSVGSCCMIRHSLIREGLRFNKKTLLGLCATVISKGYKIVADKQSIIYHPSSKRIKHRWI